MCVIEREKKYLYVCMYICETCIFYVSVVCVYVEMGGECVCVAQRLLSSLLVNHIMPYLKLRYF
jgi:hypothetical protein